MGRLGGRSREDCFHFMVEWLNNYESFGQARAVRTPTEPAAAVDSTTKEVSRIARILAVDPDVSVRISAIRCLHALIPVYVTSDLDRIWTTCVKSLEGSNCEVRVETAKLIAALLARFMDPDGGNTDRPLVLDTRFQFLSTAFIRGGPGGFGATLKRKRGSKEVRLGIAMAYVEFAKEMGTAWLEKEFPTFCRHLIEIGAKSGCAAYDSAGILSSDFLFSQRCISFVLRSVIGRMMGEQTQIRVCRELGQLLSAYLNTFDYSIELGAEAALSRDVSSSASAATLALLEISAIVRQLGFSVTPLLSESPGLLEAIFAYLIHPVLSARIAAAWSLRCIVETAPSHLSPFIDRCIIRLEHMKTSVEAVSGYSLALSSLVAASADCKLGIPMEKTRKVFSIAEDLLKTDGRGSLAVSNIEAGWMILLVVLSLGPARVKALLPTIRGLWSGVFPRSTEEAEEAVEKGDASSWQMCLQGRAGALSVMVAVASQKDLTEDHLIQSMIFPIECCLHQMNKVGMLMKSCGDKLRAPMSLLRQRVYNLLLILPVNCYKKVSSQVFRELVADIIQSDDPTSAQMTAHSTFLCSGPERSLLNPFLHSTDEETPEIILQSVNGSVGSMENDPTCLIRSSPQKFGDKWPQPDSVTIASVDAAVQVFAKIFYLISARLKLQILKHLEKNFKEGKVTPRIQAIRHNVICALAGAFRTGAEQRANIDDAELKKVSLQILLAGLSSTNPHTKCTSAEGVARLAQASADPQFTAEIIQFLLDRLGSGETAKAGWLRPRPGSWAIVSLSLVAESGGALFQSFVEPILTMCLNLLKSSSDEEVCLAIGKMLSALMTAVASDLSSAEFEGIRSDLMAACAIQLAHQHCLVRVEAIAGLQQMHLFAPQHANLHDLVISMVSSLNSEHLCIRKAAVSCLRQLLQRQADEVLLHVDDLIPKGVVDEKKKLPLPETGLEGALFGMLDLERDLEIRWNIQESLMSLVLATSISRLSNWISLCKDILASSGENSEISTDKVDKSEDYQDEDDTTLQGPKSSLPDKGKVLPRWPTRVFAMEIVQKIVDLCDTEVHLDLALAREQLATSDGDYLVLHLSELVRMAFIGATGESTELRLACLATLEDIIRRFSCVPEPEFPGHVILEQFQAQVGAALRPAFEENTPCFVTAAACQVCSSWIGSGVARDLNDLRRVHQLLLSSLTKLKDGSKQLHSESAATLEKLSILKAWAQVYITALDRETSDGDSSDSLLSLVQPETEDLISYWLCALQDAALISLNYKYPQQTQQKQGVFFTFDSVEVVREYYTSAWPSIFQATALWLKHNIYIPDKISPICETAETRFSVLLGLAVEALSSRTSRADDATVQTCLRGMIALLSSKWSLIYLKRDLKQAVEVVNTLHRVILTRDSTMVQKLCVDCARVLVEAVGRESPDVGNRSSDENYGGNYEEEGNLSGSLSFALLEFCLCLFSRQIPQINPVQMKATSILLLPKDSLLSPERANLVRCAIQLLVQIPALVSSGILLLPIVLHILVAFIRESAYENCAISLPPGHLTTVATAALQGLRHLANSPPADSTLPTWLSLQRSVLYSLLKLDDSGIMYDRCVILLAFGVVASVAPRSVAFGHSDSFNRLIRLIREELQSGNPKALQSLFPLFSRKDIASPFIKNLAPDVFNVLKPFVAGNDRIITEVNGDEASMLQEAEKLIESIVHVANDRKRPLILSLLIQSLCRLLLPTEDWRQLSPDARRLHDFSLGRLNVIATTWPAEFKSVLSAHVELKKRLEDALVFQASRNAMAVQKANKATSSSQKPTIQLKMDFAFGTA